MLDYDTDDQFMENFGEWIFLNMGLHLDILLVCPGSDAPNQTQPDLTGPLQQIHAYPRQTMVTPAS